MAAPHPPPARLNGTSFHFTPLRSSSNWRSVVGPNALPCVSCRHATYAWAIRSHIFSNESSACTIDSPVARCITVSSDTGKSDGSSTNASGPLLPLSMAHSRCIVNPEWQNSQSHRRKPIASPAADRIIHPTNFSSSVKPAPSTCDDDDVRAGVGTAESDERNIIHTVNTLRPPLLPVPPSLTGVSHASLSRVTLSRVSLTPPC